MSDLSSGEENEDVVVDNGSHMIKSGFAGGKTCTCRMPAIVGKLCGRNESFIGDSAIKWRESLSITCPLEFGIVKDWDNMTKIWDFMFRQELKVSSEFGVLITEPPLNPKSNREKIAQVLFESFGVSRLYVSMPATLALLSNGRTTGIVLDVGETVSHVAPFFDGNLISNAVRRIDFGGKDLNLYLQKLMTEQGYCFTNYSELEELRSIKEKLCHIKMDLYQTHLTNNHKNNSHEYFTLADGDQVNVGKERWLCPEAMFNPHLTGANLPGVHELLFDSLMSCDMDIRSSLFLDVFLSGSSTLFRGFQARLHNELRGLIPSTKGLRVRADPARNKSVWMGGSMLASLSCFDDCWITKAQYDEHGPCLLNQCC